MTLLFEQKIPTQYRERFKEKIVQVSDNLDIDPNWLMAVINSESGFNPMAVNPYSSATGLIQFLPSTASGLGTSTSALKNMDRVEQLYYVEKYLEPYKNNITGYTDLYLAVFYPAAMDKPASWAFPQSIYAGNAIVDVNNDGKITVRDFRKWIYKKVPKEWWPRLAVNKSAVTKFVKRNWVPITIISSLLMIVAYYFYQKKSNK